MTHTGFDVQYFIPNSLIASFLRSLCSTFVLWKVGGHALVGKETLKFWSTFGSHPDFPSLRPYVNWERIQVALFLLCVVSPGLYWNFYWIIWLPRPIWDFESTEVLTVLLITEQIYNLYMLDIKINQQYKYMVFEITTDQWLFCCVF